GTIGALSGGKHSLGSAVVYEGTSEPTNDPGGTALSNIAIDRGRLWIDDNFDPPVLKRWDGSAFEVLGGYEEGTSPYHILHNTTEEDGAGGRESRLVAKGEQSTQEITTLGYAEFSHEGTSNDEKGQFRLYLNAGSDGDTPTLAATVGSDGAVTLPGSLAVTGAFALNTDKFTIAADTGNTVIAGTLTMGADSDIAVNTDKFTLDAGTGDVGVGRNLDVTNDITFAQIAGMCAMKKSSAEIAVDGTLTVTTSYVDVTGQGDDADVLNEIVSGTHEDGTILIIANGNSSPSTEAITVNDNGEDSGNIHLGASTRVLNNYAEKLFLMKRSSDNWDEIAWANNGG
ncbi:MAG: hypothetical protein ACXABY_27175, partial [Candidatus Thorarchaeota archaeon]